MVTARGVQKNRQGTRTDARVAKRVGINDRESQPKILAALASWRFPMIVPN